MKSTLFYDESTKETYFIGNVPCDKCHKKIEEELIFEVWWSKKKHGINHYCLPCIPKAPNPPMSVVFERRYCFIISESELTETAFPIYIQPPQLAHSGGLSVFNVAEITKNSEAEIIDNTRHAGREGYTFQISPVEKKDIIPISEFQDSAVKLLEETSPFLLADQQRIKEIEHKALMKGYKFNSKITEKLKEPKSLSKEEAEDFFENVKNSVPLIEQETIPLLEQPLKEDKGGYSRWKT